MVFSFFISVTILCVSVVSIFFLVRNRTTWMIVVVKAEHPEEQNYLKQN